MEFIIIVIMTVLWITVTDGDIFIPAIFLFVFYSMSGDEEETNVTEELPVVQEVQVETIKAPLDPEKPEVTEENLNPYEKHMKSLKPEEREKKCIDLGGVWMYDECVF